MNLPKGFEQRVKSGVDLSGRTTFCIGGKAAAWFEPRDRHELARFVQGMDPRLCLFVIGAGSNLLVRERLRPRIFIHLCAKDFTGIQVKGRVVRVGAGVRIGRFISLLNTRSLAGYEFLAGIPGTIGGALAMNAGARIVADDPASYREMKDIVASVNVMDRSGEIFSLSAEEAGFGYRTSGLKPYVILSASLRLAPGCRKDVQERVRSIIQRRLRCQDWEHPSAGSFFKNPGQGRPAGYLIDRCGCKGLRAGGASVSLRHANFIVNDRQAKSEDVLKVMEIVKKRVYNRFKIRLTPEVEIVS
jgi:UDP-N-acetylmuramate dehydrogenase